MVDIKLFPSMKFIKKDYKRIGYLSLFILWAIASAIIFALYIHMLGWIYILLLPIIFYQVGVLTTVFFNYCEDYDGELYRGRE